MKLKQQNHPDCFDSLLIGSKHLGEDQFHIVPAPRVDAPFLSLSLSLCLSLSISLSLSLCLSLSLYPFFFVTIFPDPWRLNAGELLWSCRKQGGCGIMKACKAAGGEAGLQRSLCLWEPRLFPT